MTYSSFPQNKHTYTRQYVDRHNEVPTSLDMPGSDSPDNRTFLDATVFTKYYVIYPQN